MEEKLGEHWRIFRRKKKEAINCDRELQDIFLNYNGYVEIIVIHNKKKSDWLSGEKPLSVVQAATQSIAEDSSTSKSVFIW